ncbi:flagellar hook protein FlgE [Paracoccaceae bacterium GXU_MW_L88]
MNASVAGLNVNASKLATISDNIANSSTYGYKRVGTEFSSLVVAENPGTFTAGGVRVQSYRNVDAHGAVLSTNNSMDIALGGNGFLPVTQYSALGANGDATKVEYVTTGSFKRDPEGYLKTLDGLVLMGWSAEPDGTFTPKSRDTTRDLEPLRVQYDHLSATRTSAFNMAMNLPAASTMPTGTGDPYEVRLDYYGNLGTEYSMTATFTPMVGATGHSNEWTLQITDSAQADAVVGKFNIVFSDDVDTAGHIETITSTGPGGYDTATGALTLDVADGPMEISVLDSLTQYEGNFQPIGITKNGVPPSKLVDLQIDENGYVIANYDVGASKVIFQVPVANVASPNGMHALRNQTFEPTLASGDVYLWDAGDGPVGKTIGFAREQSTSDIGTELTELIQTQRAYSSNAKVVQTVDEMLQETTNIKR